MLISKKDVIHLLNSQKEDILKLFSESYKVREKDHITYSKNVFLPLTNVCRNDCGYCTFRQDPLEEDTNILMEEDKVMEIVGKGDDFGCKEALFVFGEEADQSEAVKNALEKTGFSNMIDYLYHLCKATLSKTDLLPHSNPGNLKKNELKLLREVNASMGLMLETSSKRIMSTIAHQNSPGKDPEKRVKTIKNAGKLKIPFTTGLLIGIGETVEERADSLLEIRKIQDKYGHIQEIIIQNFTPKPGIPMENYPKPPILDMMRTVAVTKLLFPDCGVQIPPNLNRDTAQLFLLAGADDWGGVSPITKDYVNPESPWPDIKELELITNNFGLSLKERLPIYEDYLSPTYTSISIWEKIDEMGFVN
jgi:FO synthase subunit 1